jgi:predicted transcriptional regulator
MHSHPSKNSITGLKYLTKERQEEIEKKKKSEKKKKAKLAQPSINFQSLHSFTRRVK